MLTASRSVSLQVSFSSNDSSTSGGNSPSGSVISGSSKNLQKESPLLSKSVNLQVSISSGNDSSFDNDEDYR